MTREKSAATNILSIFSQSRGLDFLHYFSGCKEKEANLIEDIFTFLPIF
jgi:hypothetical protein